MAITTGDTVKLEFTGRLEGGEMVFDTSRKDVAEEYGLTDVGPEQEYTPLTVEVGAKEVIEGLDEGLVGLEENEKTTVTVPPEKGYGEWSEDEIQEFDTDEIEERLGGQIPEEGDFLQTPNGHPGTVTHVGEDVIRVDFNHQLAGETLEFEVEILEIN